jgi:hypothetical protein
MENHEDTDDFSSSENHQYLLTGLVACCDIFSGETSSVKDLCSGNEYHYE